MNVAFYSERMEIYPDSLSKRGLGGSESALLNMIYAWEKNFPKDRITVFNGKIKKELDSKVINFQTIYDYKLNNELFDVLISLRDPNPFYKNRCAKINCFWSQDDLNEGKLIELQKNKYAIENIDMFFAVSEYAKKEIELGFPGKKVNLLRNGYNKDFIPKESYIPTKLREPVAIYTSTPYRGLNVLADLWPEIHKQCFYEFKINPRLEIFSGMSLYDQSDENFKNLYNNLQSLTNVHIHKPISQKDLYVELSKAKVMLYPNTFLETSCMSVLEALANGVWVITSNFGALPEQVKQNVNGDIIFGQPGIGGYRECFIRDAVYTLASKILEPNSTGLIFSWDEQVKQLKRYVSEK